MKNLLILSAIIALAYFSRFQRNVNNGKVNFPKSILNNSLPCFLVISDIHLKSGKNQESAGKDSGEDLWKSAQNKIDTLITQKHPKFLIVMGDLPFHANCNNSGDILSAQRSFETVYQNLTELAKRGKIPVIMVPGNNDSWSGDYRKFYMPKNFFNNYEYPIIDFSEKEPIEESSIISGVYLRIGGFYSAYPLGKKNGLRLIVLNTTMFVKDDSCEYNGNRDSDIIAQIKWLRGQLNEAKNLKEHILISMHIPPGIDGYETFDDNKNKRHDTDYLWNYSNNQNTFLNLIHNYQTNIIGILASHTHMDGIRLLNNKKGSIFSMIISVPGIAPDHGNNPAIKLIEYNPKTFALQNFITYYMNYWNECLNTKNSGCNEKITAWNDSFNFHDYLNYSDTLSLLQCFQKLQNENKQKDIKKIVNKIYGVNGKLQDSNAVNASIYVDYRIKK